MFRATIRNLASARATVRLPDALSKQLVGAEGGVEEIMSVKGPVFSTSVVCD